MPGTNCSVRVGGCGVFGVEGGRVGAGAGTGSGVAGGVGAGILAIGRRPAHPARSNAAESGANSQTERGSELSNVGKRSVTPCLAAIQELQ